MPPTPRPPRWYAIPVRVLLVTFIGTLISFAVSLLVGIIGTVVMSALRHVHPNMTVAYRLIALPVGRGRGQHHLCAGAGHGNPPLPPVEDPGRD